MDQIAELERQLQRTGSEASLVALFEDWFRRHVLADDRQYAAYFKEQFPALFG